MLQMFLSTDDRYYKLYMMAMSQFIIIQLRFSLIHFFLKFNFDLEMGKTNANDIILVI